MKQLKFAWLLVVVLVLAACGQQEVPGADLAPLDTTVADGDGITPVVTTALRFGDVCVGSSTTKTALVAISRSSNGKNVFKNNSIVTISKGAVTGAGLSAVVETAENANKITLPTDWSAKSSGTMSDAVGSAVTYAAPTSAGSFTGTVAYSGSGVNSDNETINRGETLAVTANVITCAPTNTAPTVPGVPNASSNPNKGVFTLNWTASSDAQSNPVTYTLEHKDADDANFSLVASGLPTTSYSFINVALEEEGTWTYRVRASDGLANGDSAFSGASNAVKVDKSAPTPPNASTDRNPEDPTGDWYLNTVTVSYSGSTDQNLGDGSAGSGVASYSAAQTFNSTGTHNYSGTATDNAGNESTATTDTVKVDATAPVVMLTCPMAPVLLNSTATASWTASDVGSGLATAERGSIALDTSSVGSKTATAGTARDNVGLESAAPNCDYTVIYNFTGFFSPVDMNGVYNVAKAGSAIPVKFKLGGDQGLNIFAMGYPKAVAVSCSTSASLDIIEETVTANASGLKYDVTADQYNYTWKTGSWANSCRRLDVMLVDGKTYSAFFRFNK